MTLNVQNLNTLIAHLEVQPPERINMGHVEVSEHACGTCGCIIGHAELAFGVEMWSEEFEKTFGIEDEYKLRQLTQPDGWRDERGGVIRYPAHRVISTLKRLRDHYLATGEIVVDWGPEPTAGEPWSAPQAVELTPPELPEEITRLLASKSNTVEV